jgi:hypothetical protein
MRGRIQRLVNEWRPSVITLGAPAFPLVVLFGLNAVDELDRTAFAVAPAYRFVGHDIEAVRLESLERVARAADPASPVVAPDVEL